MESSNDGKWEKRPMGLVVGQAIEIGWVMREWRKGNDLHQNKHGLQYTHDWWTDQDTDRHCEMDYTLRRHKVQIENPFCGY